MSYVIADIRSHPLRTNGTVGGFGLDEYRIQGTVTRLGVPGPYWVVLYSRASKRPVRAVWSATNGEYSFDYMTNPPTKYFIVAFDSAASPINAAISDFITPDAL
jgi:hypothetical protein